MATAQSPPQEVQEVRCLRVSGITGRYIHLNGTYHEEPEHSDGVPCYRKYCSSGATDDTITRRRGYWFFDKNHCSTTHDEVSEDGINNDGCCVKYDKPTETDWHITLNGIGYGQIVVKVEEVSAPYQGCAPDPIHSSLCTIMWFRDVENEEDYEEEDYYEEDYDEEDYEEEDYDEEDYDGEEYENDELPEDNTEKAKEIKDAVKAVGEQVFDIQDQLKEGDYLKLMNLLQQVTNKVNS